MNKAIKKIELDLGDKVVSLTPEQAKNLKDALDDLFGKTVVREIIHDTYPITYPLVPDPYPYRPYYWEWYQPYQVTCDIAGNLTGMMQYCANSETLRLTG